MYIQNSQNETGNPKCPQNGEKFSTPPPPGPPPTPRGLVSRTELQTPLWKSRPAPCGAEIVPGASRPVFKGPSWRWLGAQGARWGFGSFSPVLCAPTKSDMGLFFRSARARGRWPQGLALLPPFRTTALGEAQHWRPLFPRGGGGGGKGSSRHVQCGLCCGTKHRSVCFNLRDLFP